MAAERETVDRLIAHFLSEKIGATFSGRIGGVVRSVNGSIIIEA